MRHTNVEFEWQLIIVGGGCAAHLSAFLEKQAGDVFRSRGLRQRERERGVPRPRGLPAAEGAALTWDQIGGNARSGRWLTCEIGLSASDTEIRDACGPPENVKKRLILSANLMRQMTANERPAFLAIGSLTLFVKNA